MSNFLRPKNMAIIASYLLLTVTPFFPYFFGGTLAHPIQTIGATVFLWAAIWAIFKRPAYFHYLLLPAFFLLPINIYLCIFYHQNISSHHLGIIAETNPSEALSFLGNKFWLLIAIFVVIAIWWWILLRFAQKTKDLDWKDISSRITMIIIAIITFAISLYGQQFGVEPESASAKNAASEEKRIMPELPAWMNIGIESTAASDAWPFGIFNQAYDLWQEYSHLAELREKSKNFSFGAKQIPQNNEPQIIVLVLGESARYDRWSLNGYSRETTPNLQKEKQLVSFTDIVTPVSATRLSIPVIISRKRAQQSLKDGFYEKSLVTAFKEAGFKTYWISNQNSLGKFDTPVSAFAKEADILLFTNLGTSSQSNFDSVLLKPLQNALDDKITKKLIVLHTMGMHWNYSHRHPEEFDRWKPSLYGVSNPEITNKDIKEQLQNSYDNSVLYTDWFLSQVIAKLKARSEITGLLYISDHGQLLYDDDCDYTFHGRNTQYEFHIPAFVWYSEEYKKRYPQKIQQLQLHRTAKLSTENIFHSMLDMSDIHIPNEDLTRSIFSEKLQHHRRNVDSYGWSDYDNSTFEGGCREVKDKGTPLSRE